MHDVYERIADHFSHTRYGMWPRVREFVEALPLGSVVADVGAGNGKYLGANPNAYMVGCDTCSRLVQIAAERGHEVLEASTLVLPWRTGVCDAVISIAVLHHVASPERREAALREILRILRPRTGRALIYVWSFEHGGQKKGDSVVLENQQDTLVGWQVPKHFEAAKKKKTEEGAIILPGARTRTAPRRGRGRAADGSSASPSGSDVGTSAVAAAAVNTDAGTDSAGALEGTAVPVAHNPEEEKHELNVEQTHAPQPHVDEEQHARYYHMFREGELEATLLRIPGAVIESSGYDHQNWFVIARFEPPAAVEEETGTGATGS